KVPTRIPVMPSPEQNPSDVTMKTLGSSTGGADARTEPIATNVEGIPPQLGRYRILRKLGEGGMGAVYLAHDTQLDRPVALKVPHTYPGDQAAVLSRFRREARAAAGFHHPNFCPIHDVGQIDGRSFLVMAYLDGET